MRNVVHNYTEVEIKVREATSNDPWGPSSSIMAEIADLTYNATAFPEIMGMLWKRLSDHGKNWRHVYKSLMLLDYLVKTGSERVSNQCKENIYAVQTLKDFQFTDPRDGKDQGANVRERAKQLVALLKDDERLRAEREKSLKNKERFSKTTTGIGSTGGSVTGYGSGGGLSGATAASTGEEELQLQLALAMSKEEADQAEKLKREDDIRIELAIKESMKEAPADVAAAPVQAAKPVSAVDDLLNLDMMGAPAPQQPAQQSFDPWRNSASAANDPFAATTSKPVAVTDPFSQNGFSQPAPADPWGNSGPATQPSASWPASNAPTDPWGNSPTATTQAPPAADPFGAPKNDPFGNAAPVSAAVPTVAAQPSDPFGAQAQPSDPFTSPVVETTKPANDPFATSNQTSDPFTSTVLTPAYFRPRDTNPFGLNNNPSADIFSLPSAEPQVEHKNPPGSLFDMSGMDGALPQEQHKVEAPKKSAQSFLGSASGLVNLDALVTRPKQAPTNPFGPTMNEMANKTQAAQLGLQQPMSPSPVGGANPMFGAPANQQPPQPQSMFGAAPMSNQWGAPKPQQNIFGNVGQQQGQSNNPFL